MMEKYLVPGVYVELFESGVKAMQGVCTSTAGFVGMAVRGAITGQPVLLTSFADYQRRFGGYLSDIEFGAYRFLPNCVEQFFINGGSRCYVMRVAPEDAVIAKSAEGPVVVQAKNPGAWANSMVALFLRSTRACTQVLAVQDGAGEKQYQLKNATGFRVGDVIAYRAADAATYHKVTSVNGLLVTLNEPLPDDAVDREPVPKKTVEACGVDLLVRCGDIEESYPKCSLNPAAPDYLPTALEKSNLAVITVAPRDKADDLLVLMGADIAAESLQIEVSGGFNGTLDKVNADTFNGVDLGSGKRSGIEAFRDITDVSILAVPGITDANVQTKLIAHCEELADRFAVLDAPLESTKVDELNLHRSAYDSSYAALYAPWLQYYDTLRNRSVFIPPSGSVCGIYGRTDIQRGVHKAPANEVVQGCTGLSVEYNAAENGKLNPNGVNLIRHIPGMGIRIWGARTCSSNGNLKYVNIRRLFIFLEQSIRFNTGWVVFEPNDERLWSRVKESISLFLDTQWRSGALMGSTPEEAFYVNVGHSTMSQDDISNGRLICEIGVAPVHPAEFMTFRITQKMQNVT